jgi:hypothetical protein
MEAEPPECTPWQQHLMRQRGIFQARVWNLLTSVSWIHANIDDHFKGNAVPVI